MSLETKFLLFWAGQERDSVPSRSLPFAGTTELVRFALPTGSTAQPVRQDWRGLRRRFPDERRPTSPCRQTPSAFAFRRRSLRSRRIRQNMAWDAELFGAVAVCPS